jgi:hypothetical protein
VTQWSLQRADKLLTELVELIETARTVPMSGSCMVPRERALDLLDDLRERLPAELIDARQVLSERDVLLAEARDHAAQLVHDAEVRAYEIVQAGQAEHAELVSASRVHQTASEQAAQTREAAQAYAMEERTQADQYAAALRQDAQAFADRTLADLVDVLQQAMATAEQGRDALSHRGDDANPTTISE